MPLYKTTITIWSDVDTNCMDLQSICYEAEGGSFYCEKQDCELIEDKEQFPKTFFFDKGEIGQYGQTIEIP